MSNTCETIHVKPTNADQGDFVVINKADFDPAVHQLMGTDKDMSKAEIQSALDAKGIAYKPAQPKAELQALLDAA